MTRESTDLPVFRQALSEELGPYDDATMSQKEVDKWKALNFLNAVEIKHAELVDDEGSWGYDLISNSIVINRLRKQIGDNNKTYIERFSSEETVYGGIDDQHYPNGTTHEANATFGESGRYNMLDGFTRILLSCGLIKK